MIQKFFKTQLKTKTSKDWISMVEQNLKELELEETMAEIKVLKKTTLKRILNKAIIKKAFERLMKQAENHSKSKNVKYSELKMQNYLKPSRIKISQIEIETIFKLRSRMTDVKLNFRSKYENLECRACFREDESQKHIYECIEVIKNNQNKTKMIQFENIFGENTRYQVEIAKIFLENLNKLK